MNEPSLWGIETEWEQIALIIGVLISSIYALTHLNDIFDRLFGKKGQRELFSRVALLEKGYITVKENLKELSNELKETNDKLDTAIKERNELDKKVAKLEGFAEKKKGFFNN